MNLANEFEDYINGPDYKDPLDTDRNLSPEIIEFFKDTRKLQKKSKSPQIKIYYEGVEMGAEFILWLAAKNENNTKG